MAPEPLTALALRHAHSSIPTLLVPLRSISNTPLLDGGDDLDDLQSNAWVSTPSYRAPLAGLGITYLRDEPPVLDDQTFPEDRMQVDGDDGPLFSIEALDDFPASDFPGTFESRENRRMAQFISNHGESINRMELGLDNDIGPTMRNMVGLIPDVNMYDKLRRLDQPHPGVNPLDTIRSTPLHDVAPYYGEHSSPVPGDHRFDNILSETDPRHEPSPSPRLIRDIMAILVHPAPECSPLPWPPASSPSAEDFSPSQLAVPELSVSTKVHANGPDSEHYALPAPGNLEYSNTTSSSPILNAHLGIELGELISRAERFRSKYPEREIDRAWLSHFAGKLSDRGELLNDFRCYVIGCDQRNKRRDHILVHVGAHIGQRPFACSLCPLRFLRKNECKRHEASHSGSRPYNCDICGQSFVRQDLVRRHVKRTHGLRDENHSGATKQSRKKARRSIAAPVM